MQKQRNLVLKLNRKKDFLKSCISNDNKVASKKALQTFFHRKKRTVTEKNKVANIFNNHFVNIIKTCSSQCSLLIPLETSENQSFSDVFKGIKREHWEVKS